VNWRVAFGLFGVYRHLIAKEPSCVFCVSLIVIDRGDGRIRSLEFHCMMSLPKSLVQVRYTDSYTVQKLLGSGFDTLGTALIMQVVQKTRVHPQLDGGGGQITEGGGSGLIANDKQQQVNLFHLRRRWKRFIPPTDAATS